MSEKQFETFYWPTLKKVMMAYINEGLVPMPFAEGDYEPRLDIITDMPKASEAARFTIEQRGGCKVFWLSDEALHADWERHDITN